MDCALPTRREVAAFLNQFRVAIDYGGRALKDRQKNTQGLIDLGINERQAWDIVMQLTPDSYCAGPIPDDTDQSKDVWIFGHLVSGTLAYIKLRLAPMRGKRHVNHALLWAFHPAEHPMTYPLRQEEV